MEKSSAESSNGDVIVTNVKKQKRTNAERQKEYRQRKKEKEKIRSSTNASNAHRQQSVEKKPHAQRQKAYEQRQKSLPSKSQGSLFDNLQSEKNSCKCKKYRAKSNGKTFEEDDGSSSHTGRAPSEDHVQSPAPVSDSHL
ncbi:uncharacterized protein LOC132936549 [Metopolophium dirhodum]|uniref:uncharacterized protein LOC132936549 n=1 Tax=Metopolophium dirhodum TaxID=44670 RepID=UPI00298F78F7|nr:uncharacterized protein LOC132936549 [Metopolophium dirhodum]